MAGGASAVESAPGCSAANGRRELKQDKTDALVQIAFADPQGNQPLPAAAVVEHFDDAARGDVTHRGADLIEPVAFVG